MMRTIKVIFLLSLFWMSSQTSSLAAFEEKFAFPVGERFEFDIKKLGLDVGDASITYNGLKNIDGRQVYVITFVAESLNFYDEDKIFIDPTTFYPFKVERDLNIWGSKEKITEIYDEEKGIVRITKTVKNKTTEMVIEKKARIDNLYCFISRFRKMNQVELGNSFVMNLPTVDLKVNLVKINTLKVSGKKRDSLFLQSDPKKYKVWFDTSSKRIPLRIDAFTKGGNNSMVLKNIDKHVLLKGE